MKWFYRCPSCGARYDIVPGRYLCDACSAENAPGAPLRGVLECAWEGDWSGAARWAGGPPEDFRPADVPLPVPAEFFPPIPAGDTPLWEAPRLREATGFPRLFLKDDTCEPSGSYKDRASFLVAAFARQHRIAEVALASTGNAASSMAAVGAAAGLAVTVFLPAAAPVAKRVQVLQYGAELREVAGTYDLAFDQSLEYSEKTGTLSRNTAYNPLTIEGKKTSAFEIAADLARLAGAVGGTAAPSGSDGAVVRRRAATPDHVFVPTGDGVIISGVIRGFEDLLALGAIERMPIVWAAQAEGSSAIARALWRVQATAGGGAAGEGPIEDPFAEVIPSSTIADSISVDAPRNGPYALAKLVKYGGRAVTVSDEEILSAQRLASSTAGLFAEPSSACALAGFLKVRGEIDPGETVVVLLTGSGLKDVKSAAAAVGALSAFLS